MNTLNLLLLSIVQGITESLPISSSAHLILTGEFLNFEVSGNLLLLAMLHLGTTLAIIVFYRDILFKDFFTKKKWLFFLKIAIASIPVGLAGLFLQDYISSTLHSIKIIAVSLIVVGVFFILFENMKKKDEEIEPEKLSLGKMIGVGIAQVLALIPGTSRSGITILMGMMLGMDKYSAFQFSFILGIPIILASTIFGIVKNHTSITELLSISQIVVIISVTFALGYLSLLVVKKFKKSKWLTVFGIYRIIVGILILLFAI